MCFRRRLWPRGSSCVCSVRGVIAVSPTLTTTCDNRYDDLSCSCTVYCFLQPFSRLPLFPFQAFLGVCDVLTAHSYQLHVWDPTSFGPLLYTPSPKLQRALLTFVCAHAFAGRDCESQSRGEISACFHESYFQHQNTTDSKYYSPKCTSNKCQEESKPTLNAEKEEKPRF